jgi:hypothetical protein
MLQAKYMIGVYFPDLIEHLLRVESLWRELGEHVFKRFHDGEGPLRQVSVTREDTNECDRLRGQFRKHALILQGKVIHQVRERL